ncbi:hemerythrin domain-containing protein [Halosquirtibacter laminarini]|uniref:Hemerythrin domain-containing protein n=1 Tax=Halosquirtibacter laminarini TaxID=3374600 RepID=A0AC61NJT4_9BACT|nr:hemerythrin domain-containing protein [Prolixibacteraceae bacterium]
MKLNHFPKSSSNLYQQDTQLADVIMNSHLHLSVINHFDIPLGFGNKTIKEVCQQHGINLHFFLIVINSFSIPNYFPKKELLEFDLKLIIEYLMKTHQYYLHKEIPKLESCISRMQRVATQTNWQSIQLISRFFFQYKEELIKHLYQEDHMFFPYIYDLIEKKENLTYKDPVLLNSSIFYSEKHENLGVKVSDLKNLIVKYIPSNTDQETCQQLLIQLIRLEIDLENHRHIEEKVLIPKVQILEQVIQQNNGSK